MNGIIRWRSSASSSPPDVTTTYDRIARFYDVDMAQNMRFDDVAFYAHACARARGKVLEVGCGNGRILLPASQRAATGIEKRAVLLGMGDRFELWGEQAHLAKIRETIGEDQITEDMAELKL